VVWTYTFIPNRPLGGHSGCLALACYRSPGRCNGTPDKGWSGRAGASGSSSTILSLLWTGRPSFARTQGSFPAFPPHDLVRFGEGAGRAPAPPRLVYSLTAEEPSNQP
jgi:hypothetical protein